VKELKGGAGMEGLGGCITGEGLGIGADEEELGAATLGRKPVWVFDLRLLLENGWNKYITFTL
jgi:hypothetical protein